MTVAHFSYLNNIFNSFEISGHSDYNVKGLDIVCSGITTAAFTSINLLVELIDEKHYQFIQKEEDGYLKFSIIDFNLIDNQSMINLIIDNLINMLKQIEANYSNHLRVKINNKK